MDNKNESVFRDIARRYAETDGGLLRRELAQMRVGYVLPNPALDRRLRAKVDRHKRKNVWMGVGGSLAACVAVLFILTLSSTMTPAKDGRAVMDSSEPPAEAAGFLAPPTTFTLPQNLAVSGFKQDQGQSIYILSDTLGDDVVLIIEQTDRQIEGEGLTLITIDDQPVYALEAGDYHLLACRKDGVLYTMTCRYDINTLVPICKNILNDS